MTNNYRVGLFLAVCFVGALNVACPFSKSVNSDVRPIGPTVNADLLMYFNSGVSSEQIESFSTNILFRPDPSGRGESLAPGVRTFLRIRAVEGHAGIAITFFPDATNEQRQELREAIRASPLIYKVLENTAPGSVKTLK